jgi:hypothetical protein
MAQQKRYTLSNGRYPKPGAENFPPLFAVLFSVTLTKRFNTFCAFFSPGLSGCGEISSTFTA